MVRDRDERPMAVDDRLRRAFDELDEPPADDLWDRLVRAIAEDEARRRRRRLLAVALVAVAVLVGALALRPGALGGWVLDWRWLEVLETAVMLAVVVGLRPLLDGVGRDYLVASFGGSVRTATTIAPLLDLAWNLVFVGVTLMTVQWHPTVPVGAGIAMQLDQALERVAVLLGVMGVLHGVTFLALPVVGVVWRAATTGQRIPRWVLVMLVLAGGPLLVVLAVQVIGLLSLGLSG